MSDPTGGSYGVDPTVLEKDGFSLACLAVEYDTKGEVNNAIFYYGEAGQALLSAALAGSQMPSIVEKANEYILRAEALKKSGQKSLINTPSQKSQQQFDMDRAVFLLNQGFEEDENANKDEAAELYSQAVEMFLKIRQESTDPAVKDKVTKLATQALERAEFLKKGNKVKPKVSTPTLPGNRAVSKGTSKVMPILGFGAFLDDDEKPTPPPGLSSPSPSNTAATRGIQSTGSGEFSKEEIDVLRRTSDINGRKYVPFMAIDVKERFAFPVAFTDKDGKLALSPKQRSKFTKWVRPEEFIENPQMIMAVSSMSIRQTIVSDCSFVASLAISAQYERRFKKKLITSTIYPQNRRGEPVYNPCGKYMVKLHLNGVHRKVVIDDYLPMGQYGELLCSYSNNHSELWVSLLEKAYMKVMGGYDFPGSNSNIDLHALTGWIPERVAIRPGTEEFDKEREFKRLQDRFHQGHCLVTVATGEMSEAEGDRAGLVPTHAYALLDIREVMGKRLLMLKNPWNHLRWKGRFSERDLDNWTPSLQRALNYDPKSAQSYDNGVFWIDYDSLCRFYDVIYINWNPDLFSHTSCWHHTWHAKEGPKKDSYNMSDNPQYRLEVKAGGPSAIWILLTRHIVDKDDFADNKEFITVLVYKTDGKKVFYPYDPPPYKDGVRINSPHYLCKMVEERGTNRYTLVISQYAKNNTIHYTLRVFATCEFSLTEIRDPFNEKYSKRFTGQWKGKTAGGCANYPQSYNNNPTYQFKIDNAKTDNHVLIELLGPKQYSVGFNVVCVTENVSDSPTSFKKKTSGDFRPGYCVLQIDNIPGGVYNVIPCTFQPGKEGPFFLDFSCSGPIGLSQLQ